MQIAIDWIRSQWTGGYIETSLLQREVRCRVTARSADTKKNLENVRTVIAITRLPPSRQTRLSARTIEKMRAHEDNASVSRGRERVL